MWFLFSTAALVPRVLLCLCCVSAEWGAQVPQGLVSAA